MKIIGIVFKKEILDIYRDKKTFIVGILLPLILFPIIFGFMGKGMGNDKETVTKSTTIAIVDQYNSKLKAFLESKDNIKVIDVDDIEKAVDKGKIFVAVTIPKGFDDAIKNEKSANLEIYYDSSSSKSSMALNIVSSYVKEYSKLIVTERLNARNIDTSILSPIKAFSKK
ncbi:ABC-2 family transporter protein [Clostridium tepidiprofundi DSM 19306]|uniref:ABC-2 family transporter protein n=1 Tax=Clostridium tepidiprofundi DSM 19306 TaxID=1121338 RepID=A0A151B0I4_9CLOT|nr:ABC transporter permease [Clostridium tepidiprofundi]KYH33293.1 ABC-2 family transporter protein [Clostridium tepidiprofundi DSM 19306]